MSDYYLDKAALCLYRKGLFEADPGELAAWAEHLTQVIEGEKDVFPAHAGMSPNIAQKGTPLEGFPRSRGDEPPIERLSTAQSLFSPLTRG